MFDILPIRLEDKVYCYALSEAKQITAAKIGHVRGYFDAHNGGQPFTTWFDALPYLKSADFRADLALLMDELYNTVLKDFKTMSAECRSELVTPLGDDTYAITAFHFPKRNAKYVYFIRLIPRRGDYNFYVMCYDKEHHHAI